MGISRLFDGLQTKRNWKFDTCIIPISVSLTRMNILWWIVLGIQNFLRFGCGYLFRSLWGSSTLSKVAFFCQKGHFFVISGIPLSEVAFCCQKWHSFVKSGILLSKVALISFVYSLYKPDENIEFDLDLTTTWVRRHCFIYA